jgi:predicted CXXCH cytochrome family protein
MIIIGKIIREAIKLVGIFTALTVSCGFLSAQTRPAANEPPSVTAKTISRQTGAGYAGNDRCRACHKPEVIEFGKTAHASLPEHNDSVVGCEMCHGAGKAHADAQEAAHGDDAKSAAANKLIFAFKGSPKANSERCLQCHQTSKDQSQFDHSSHARNGVACLDCHAIHLVEASDNPKGESVQSAQAKFFSVPSLPEEHRWLTSSLLKRNQPELCYQCHGNVRASFALATHHRVPEGAMKCTDCHSPHGTNNLHEMHQAGTQTCTSCHTEKRGPFVFEHAASRVEGCTACHTPHGSSNKMLLARREERVLCLQCHVGSPSTTSVMPHNLQSFQAQGTCTRCHSVIHGSNFDKDFLN